MDPLRRRPILTLALVGWLSACGAPGPSLLAGSTSAASPAPAAVNPSIAPSASSADRDGAAARIGADLASLQAVADANHGIRAAGTPGYEASVDHAATSLRQMPGGLFAGATETGGAAEPSSGGGGGIAPDPCYHIGCDDLDNVDVERVVLFAEVTAAVVQELLTD
jgi:hypothetical protein